MTSSFRVRIVTAFWLTRQQTLQREQEWQDENMPHAGGGSHIRKSPRDACNHCSHKFELGDVYVSRSGRNRVYRCGACAVRLGICTQADIDAVLATRKPRAVYGEAVEEAVLQ